MNTEQIHDIIRQARSKYYDLASLNGDQYMCLCVSSLECDGDITAAQYDEVVNYISTLIGGGEETLFSYLYRPGMEREDMKAAQLKFWDDLLGGKE